MQQRQQLSLELHLIFSFLTYIAEQCKHDVFRLNFLIRRFQLNDLHHVAESSPSKAMFFRKATVLISFFVSK